MADYTEAKAARSKMNEAIEEYVKACAKADEQEVVMTASVVLWEQARFDTDGVAEYDINYCFPTETSLTAAAGLVELGYQQAMMDMGPDPHGDE